MKVLFYDDTITNKQSFPFLNVCMAVIIYCLGLLGCSQSHQDAVDLHYAALRPMKGTRLRREPTSIVNDCVYAAVQQ